MLLGYTFSTRLDIAWPLRICRVYADSILHYQIWNIGLRLQSLVFSNGLLRLYVEWGDIQTRIEQMNQEEGA
jgi:uncharacterized membrane protein YjfL (UPF0719 family)